MLLNKLRQLFLMRMPTWNQTLLLSADVLAKASCRRMEMMTQSSLLKQLEAEL
jgi:hypothetical protein